MTKSHDPDMGLTPEAERKVLDGLLADIAVTPTPAARLTATATAEHVCPDCLHATEREPELKHAGLHTERATGRFVTACTNCDWARMDDPNDPDDARDRQRDAEEAAQVDRTLGATIRNLRDGMGDEPDRRCDLLSCRADGVLHLLRAGADVQFGGQARLGKGGIYGRDVHRF